MTKTSLLSGVFLFAGIAFAGAAPAQPGRNGGTAPYWMSAETASGTAAMMGTSGAGQAPSRGAIAGAPANAGGRSNPDGLGVRAGWLRFARNGGMATVARAVESG
jgi:hypothetical protein